MKNGLIIGIPFFFLLGSFFVTGVTSAFRSLRRQSSKDVFTSTMGSFFYRHLHDRLFKKEDMEGLLLALVSAQNILRFGYASSCLYLLTHMRWVPWHSSEEMGIRWTSFDEANLVWTLSILGFSFCLFMGLFIGDILPRSWGNHRPRRTLSLFGPLASLFLFLNTPLYFVIFHLLRWTSPRRPQSQNHSDLDNVTEKVLEIIEESASTPELNSHDRDLIESAIEFRHRIVREIMVPRVDAFTLSEDISIREAASLLVSESFSRTPVYRESVDHIIGILMYHDLLRVFGEADQRKDPSLLEQPIGTIVREAFYTPETMKVSRLLQEFRRRQIHLAIVVDEYGGTEGIISIEDILEEIVGEIADEYDTEEVAFQDLPEGGWIVDAKMSILDIQDYLGILIPQDGDYDTLGGYIFHKAGAIPAKGLVIHQDLFELEIIESTDRSIEKVRITPLAPQESKESFSPQVDL